MTDDEFLAAFEACTLARADWTHEAHVRTAWLYLIRRPFADALRLVREGIPRLNRARGADPDAYHDTITVAFVRVIAARLGDPGESFPAFRGRNPDLLAKHFPALLRHYSEGRLYSADARRGFVEPDRDPLPGPPPHPPAEGPPAGAQPQVE